MLLFLPSIASYQRSKAISFSNDQLHTACLFLFLVNLFYCCHVMYSRFWFSEVWVKFANNSETKNVLTVLDIEKLYTLLITSGFCFVSNPDVIEWYTSFQYLKNYKYDFLCQSFLYQSHHNLFFFRKWEKPYLQNRFPGALF